MKSQSPTMHVAFLRAINVGGHRQVGMADLRDLFVKLGFSNVRSLLQSGNLVFLANSSLATDEIEGLLEVGAEKRLGLRADFFVRTAVELKAAIAKNPFPSEAKRDPAHLVAMFLKTQPSAKQAATLEGAITGRETFRVIGRLAYIIYPDGIGNSKLTNALIDRKLETRGTGRNWNTVLKLVAMTET